MLFLKNEETEEELNISTVESTPENIKEIDKNDELQQNNKVRNNNYSFPKYFDI